MTFIVENFINSELQSSPERQLIVLDLLQLPNSDREHLELLYTTRPRTSAGNNKRPREQDTQEPWEQIPLISTSIYYNIKIVEMLTRIKYTVTRIRTFLGMQKN